MMLTIKRLPRGLWISVFTVVIACAFYSWVQTQRLAVGAQDIGTTALGIWDEFLITRSAHGMLLRNDWDYRIPVYPALYPYLNRMLVSVAHALLGASESVTVKALRALSWALALACAWACWALTLRLFARRYMLAAAMSVILLASPEIVRWGGRVHPETLLLFVMLLATASLVMAARAVDARMRQQWLVVSTILAGAAAATKLVGVFMLPALVLVACTREVPLLQPRAYLRLWAKHSARTTGLFLAAFVVLSPPAVFAPRTFWRGLAKQAEENLKSSGSAWDWPATSVQALGWTVALLGTLKLVLTLATWLKQVKRDGWLVALQNPQVSRVAWALVLLVLVYGGYVVLTVKIVVPRYILPLWPALAWLTMLLLEEAKRWTHVAFALLLVVDLSVGASSALRAIAQETQTAANDLRLSHARPWLSQNLLRSYKVFYDTGAYVPYSDTFHYSWGLLRSQIERQQADVLVVYAPRRAIYQHTPDAQDNSRKARMDRERVATYAALEAGTLLDFVRVKDFPEAQTTVYARAHIAAVMTAE